MVITSVCVLYLHQKTTEATCHTAVHADTFYSAAFISFFFSSQRQSVAEKLIYREQRSNETQKCHLRRAPGIILFNFFMYYLGVMKVSIKTLMLWLQHSSSSHRVTLSTKQRQSLLEVKGSGLFWSYLQG